MQPRACLMAMTGAMMCPSVALASYDPAQFVMDTWRTERGGTDLVIYNFRASWSLTGNIQAELLDEIICSDARFAGLRIVEVDWDTFGPSQMAQRLKVTRHSTLVAVRGTEVIARVESASSERALVGMLEAALAG